MTPTSYPLSWPQAWPRTKSADRKRAAFHGHTHKYNGGIGQSTSYKRELAITEGFNRLEDQLEMIGATNLVLSTNLRRRMDGMPTGSQNNPADPGAAVYFKLRGKDHVLACDKWDRCADNIAALAKTVEAMRGIERWGVGTLEQRFSGYKALPESTVTTCWKVLEIDEGSGVDAIWTAYRKRAHICHPDKGGSTEAFTELRQARDTALQFHNSQ